MITLETDNIEINDDTDFEEQTDDQLFDELDEIVEQYDKPAPDAPAPGSLFDNADPDEDIESISEINKDAAGVITFLVTEGTTLAATALAQAETSDKYKIDTKKQNKLKHAIYKVLPTRRKFMPVWLMLILVILTTIGPTLIIALNDRSTNKRNRELETENRILRKKLMKRKKRKQAETNTDTES